MGGYRENSLPPEELRGRANEKKKTEEEKRYRDDLESRWESHKDTEAPGVPSWAQERFRERKEGEARQDLEAALRPDQKEEQPSDREAAKEALDRLEKDRQASIQETRDQLQRLDTEDDKKG